jgi:hypothetical protein
MEIRTQHRTGTAPRSQSKAFVWKHKKSLNADLVLARKAGLALIINSYTYFTHDRWDNPDLSLRAWFTAWGVACPEALDKSDGQQYSLDYLRIYAGKVQTVVEGGFTIGHITSISKLEELCDKVNGKSAPKPKKSVVDAEVERLAKKLSKAQVRSLIKKLEASL